MEVLDNVGPEGFLCHRCHHNLTLETDRNSGGHEQSTRLNEQFKFISELLPKIDAVHIPECDFTRALSKARPVVRDATHQRAATIPVDSGADRPMAVKGLTNTGPQSIAVNISTSDGPNEAEKAAEQARKEKIAKQNALPAWMSQSTVTGESFSGMPGTGGTAIKKEEVGTNTTEFKAVNETTNTQIDDIFERLKAEQAAERARKGENEEYGSDEEDEDEGEFEDVPATGHNSNSDTPMIPAIKRETSGEASREGESSDEPEAKRVKVEPHITKDEDEEDSEEDVEFEDV